MGWWGLAKRLELISRKQIIGNSRSNLNLLQKKKKYIYIYIYIHICIMYKYIGCERARTELCVVIAA